MKKIYFILFWIGLFNININSYISSSEIKKALNWYDLTDKGFEVIQRLDIKWNEKEMNEILFNSSENRIV